MTRRGTCLRGSVVMWVEQVTQVEQVLCCEQTLHGCVKVGGCCVGEEGIELR